MPSQEIDIVRVNAGFSAHRQHLAEALALLTLLRSDAFLPIARQLFYCDRELFFLGLCGAFRFRGFFLRTRRIRAESEQGSNSKERLHSRR